MLGPILGQIEAAVDHILDGQDIRYQQRLSRVSHSWLSCYSIRKNAYTLSGDILQLFTSKAPKNDCQ